MANTGKDEVAWAELQRQLDAKGLKVKRGTMQDTTFIEADPWSSKKMYEGTLRLAAAEMGLAQRKERRAISVTSSIKKKKILITALSKK